MGRPRKAAAAPASTAASDKRTYIEIRKHFLAGVEEVATEMGMDRSEAVNFLIREGLERRGKWPPQPVKGHK